MIQLETLSSASPLPFFIYYIRLSVVLENNAQKFPGSLLSGCGMWIYSRILDGPASPICLLHPTNSLITLKEMNICEER